MTNPGPFTPHQDPTPQTSPVSIMEYVTTVIASLDRRFDSLHEDLKDSIDYRFHAVGTRFDDIDLRYQQRFDAQQIALKEALLAQDKAVAAALIAAEKAVAKAEAAAEKRFDSVNEFRGQLSDQAATFMPRAEFEATVKAITEKIDDLKTYQWTTTGKSSGLTAGWGYLIGGISLIVVVVNVIIALASR